LISIVAALILFIVPAEKIGNAILRIAGLIMSLAGGVYVFYAWKNRPIVQEPVEVVNEISGEIETNGE